MIITNKTCYGCTACSMVCPKNAIKMVENDKGFLNPIIDEKKCINCGLCTKVCHTEQSFNVILKTYIAKLSERNSRIMSQSGGAFVSISNIILENNGVVYGVVLDEEFEAVHVRACSIEERNRMCGSKYTQSRLENVFHSIENDLMDRQVLFSGTPCQVNGLISYLRNKKVDMSRLYTIDLICHGVPSIKIWRDVIAYYERKMKSDINLAIFRDKRYGWKTHFSTFVIDNKLVIDKLHRKLFYSNLCLRDSCYECEFARIDRVGDFTIGDAWGIHKYNPEFVDEAGVSVITFNSQKALQLLPYINEQMDMKEVNIGDYKQGNMEKPSRANRNVEEFWNDYHKKSFLYIVCKYAKNYKLLNVKYIIKRIINKIKVK